MNNKFLKKAQLKIRKIKNVSPKAALRLVLYYFSIAFAVVFAGAPFAFFHCYLKNDWHDFTSICCGFFQKLFKIFHIELEVEGKENIPKKSGFVIVSNHQSFLDINAIFAGVSHTAFLAKSDLWKIPYFGWIMRKTGSIPIYRSDPKKNAGMGWLLSERLKQGYNVCVFPEGKRAGDGVMFRFQNGIFRVAKTNPIKILPITLIGTSQVLPKNRFGLFPGKIKIVVHRPIEPSEYEETRMEDLRDGIHDVIESALPYTKAKN